MSGRSNVVSHSSKRPTNSLRWDINTVGGVSQGNAPQSYPGRPPSSRYGGIGYVPGPVPEHEVGASPSVLGRDDKIQSQLAEPRKIPLPVEPRP